MIKHYLKLTRLMLCLLLLGICIPSKADYVSTITSGSYYRIVSAYSGLTDKVVMYATSEGMKYKVYNATTDAQDGSMVFQITADGKFKNYDAYNIKSIVGDLYMFHASYQWGRGYTETGTTADAGYNILTSTTAWKQCIDEISGTQFMIQPAHDTGSTLAQCASLNGTTTEGNLVLNGWSHDDTYDNSDMVNQTRAWQFEEVSAADVAAIIAANDALATALDTYHTAYNTLVSSNDVGYYNKSNVDAFKAYYETCLTAYNNGNNTLTAAEKSTYASSLAAAYTTAISARNLITDGYYVIKSAASAFGSNEYAMYIDDSGNFLWKAYDDASLGKFLFRVEDQNSTCYFDSQNHEQFTFYSPLAEKYIGKGTSQMGGTGTSSDEVWKVSVTYVTAPQIILQPQWTESAVSQCLSVNTTSATSGTLSQPRWLDYNANGTTSCWTFLRIDDATAQAALASFDPLSIALDELADAYVNLDYGTNPGEYAQAGVEAFKTLFASDITAYNGGDNTLTRAERQAMADALNAAYQTAITTVIPLTDGYYNIISAYPVNNTKKLALYIAKDGTIGWKDYNETNAEQFVFKVTEREGTKNNDNGRISYAFALQNIYSSLYVGPNKNASAINSGMNDDAASINEIWDVLITNADKAQFILQPKRLVGSIGDITQSLTVQGDLESGEGTIRHTVWCGAVQAGDLNGCWKFEKVDLEAVTIGATGYSTYVSDKALVIPEGVTAYGVTGVEGTEIVMQQLSGNVLAANEPVILAGEAGKKYYFIATDEIGSTISGNTLEGTGTTGKAVGNNEAYVLYDNNGTAVFRVAAAMTLPAHKAYLPASVVGSSGAKEFSFGDLTGINDATDNGQWLIVNGQSVYDLSGRKVAAPQKGQLYIVNGKKVLY